LNVPSPKEAASFQKESGESEYSPEGTTIFLYGRLVF